MDPDDQEDDFNVGAQLEVKRSAVGLSFSDGTEFGLARPGVPLLRSATFLSMLPQASLRMDVPVASLMVRAKQPNIRRQSVQPKMQLGNGSVDGVPIVQRRSYSLVESVDPITIMIARMKVMEADVERLRVVDTNLQNTFFQLATTVQTLVQDMMALVPVMELSNIGDAFQASLSASASSSSLTSTGSRRLSISGDAMTAPPHLAQFHQHIVQSVEFMSLLNCGADLLLDDDDEDDEDHGNEVDVGDLEEELGDELQHNKAAFSAGTRRDSAGTDSASEQRDNSTSSDDEQRDSFASSTCNSASSREHTAADGIGLRRSLECTVSSPAWTSSVDTTAPQKRRRALFNSMRGEQREGPIPEESSNTPSSSLLSRLLRRSPTTKSTKTSLESDDGTVSTASSVSRDQTVASTAADATSRQRVASVGVLTDKRKTDVDADRPRTMSDKYVNSLPFISFDPLVPRANEGNTASSESIGSSDTRSWMSLGRSNSNAGALKEKKPRRMSRGSKKAMQRASSPPLEPSSGQAQRAQPHRSRSGTMPSSMKMITSRMH